MNLYPIAEADVFAHRPKPFYFITTNEPADLTYEAMTASLAALREEGFGGIVLFNKPPRGFHDGDYLTDAWFDMVRNAARACRDLGLVMWINSGFDFPPGSVAGKVRAIDPSLVPKCLKLTDGTVTVEEVPWGFPAFEHPRSAELFCELVYEAYLRNVGEYFGDPIVGFFSDTDNRRVDAGAMFDPNSPKCNYFPWSDTFRESFSAHYGYDIMPYLPEILQCADIPQAVDYWEHAGHLYQSWLRAGQRWLHEHGLLLTGHAGDTSPFLRTEAPRSSAFTEGRFLDVGACFDYPGTDQELYAIDGGKHMRAETYYKPEVVWGCVQQTLKMTAFADISEDMRAKQAAATAYLTGAPEVMCEMFAATNFGVSAGVLKRIAAFQIMQGITYIVTHAYHHRFFGEAKYFAPPDFSTQSLLSHSARALNDLLAQHCAMMAAGEAVYPIALIDPTEELWRSTFVKEPYFAAFSSLNRQPWGFTVCDRNRLATDKNHRFRVAVAAGIRLTAEERAAIEANGIKVLDGYDQDAISALLCDCDVRWDGEGTPHFARRRIGGEEFVFIANIEQETPIRGHLHAYGREEALVLWPGDIRYLSAHYDDIPTETDVSDEKIMLPAAAPVTFTSPNTLSLEYFVCDGEAVPKNSDAPYLTVPFTAAEEIAAAELLIPMCCMEYITRASLDGMPLTYAETRVFDDLYAAFALPPLSCGQHELVMEKTAPIPTDHLLFLRGSFDVRVDTGYEDPRSARHTYNLHLCIPASCKITLSARRSVFETGLPWHAQGHPFYSGGVTYHVPVSIPHAGLYQLSLGQVRDTVYVSVNGEKTAAAFMPPYDLPLVLEAGENLLEITVYNTLANLMEGYAEDGGLLDGGYLCEVLPNQTT